MSARDEVGRTLLARVTPPLPAGPLSMEEQTAVDVARSWTRLILQPAFQPPSDARHVPTRAEAGAFDTVRVWDPSALGEVHLAQTFCVLAVTLPGGGARDVTAIARRLLQQRDRIRLTVSGTDGDTGWGQQAPPDHDGHRDWLGHLRWWKDAAVLGFLTLKTADAPGRAIMGWGPELNQLWFQLYAERGSR
ncbi:MAG TPA: hypothetical protein VFQ51_20560 [Vicinamibacteria bacterium]|nr:hypothetical protein [Vicinamibacteria bacterium]